MEQNQLISFPPNPARTSFVMRHSLRFALWNFEKHDRIPLIMLCPTIPIYRTLPNHSTHSQNKAHATPGNRTNRLTIERRTEIHPTHRKKHGASCFNRLPSPNTKAIAQDIHLASRKSDASPKCMIEKSILSRPCIEKAHSLRKTALQTTVHERWLPTHRYS